jgi:hypothetical protein
MIFLTNRHGWPSEFTRGRQIAEALGCGVDVPMKSYDETIVAIKTLPDKEQAKMFSNFYLDMIDSCNIVEVAEQYPTAKIIVLTDIMRDVLSQRIKNKLVLIPEHCCNFGQELRDVNRAVSIVGYVGARKCLSLDPREVTRVLKQIGLEFKYLICEDHKVTRKDVCEFYKSIDIQLAFRTPDDDIRPQEYRNPLKIFNAGSFGIPTVAFPEISYTLCAGTYFLEATCLGSVLDKCYMLKNDRKLYEFYANRVYNWSQQFDISEIARLYAKLSPDETFDIDNNINKMRKAG